MSGEEKQLPAAQLRAAELQQEARREAARLDAVLAGTPEGAALVLAERRLALQVREGELLASGLRALGGDWKDASPGAALLLRQWAEEAGVSLLGLARGAYFVHGRLELTAATQLALARRAGIEIEYEWSSDGREVVAVASIGGKVRREKVVVAEQAARGKSTEWKADPRGMAEYAAGRRLLRRWSSLPLGTLEEPPEEVAVGARPVELAPIQQIQSPQVQTIRLPAEGSRQDLYSPEVQVPARVVAEAPDPTGPLAVPAEEPAPADPPKRRRGGGL